MTIYYYFLPIWHILYKYFSLSSLPVAINISLTYRYMCLFLSCICHYYALCTLPTKVVFNMDIIHIFYIPQPLTWQTPFYDLHSCKLILLLLVVPSAALCLHVSMTLRYPTIFTSICSHLYPHHDALSICPFLGALIQYDVLTFGDFHILASVYPSGHSAALEMWGDHFLPRGRYLQISCVEIFYLRCFMPIDLERATPSAQFFCVVNLLF